MLTYLSGVQDVSVRVKLKVDIPELSEIMIVQEIYVGAQLKPRRYVEYMNIKVEPRGGSLNSDPSDSALMPRSLILTLNTGE